jgi:hypothetical protein
VFLHPSVCFDKLDRMSRGCEDLRYQCVRVQSDGCHELLQLVGRPLGRLSWCKHRLIGLTRERVVRNT